MVCEFNKSAFQSDLLKEIKNSAWCLKWIPDPKDSGFSLKGSRIRPTIPFVGKEADAERKEAY